MNATPRPPSDYPQPVYRVAIAASVWGAWRQRAEIALHLLAYALGLLSPVLLRRDRQSGRWTLRPNAGGTLRARAGDLPEA